MFDSPTLQDQGIKTFKLEVRGTGHQHPFQGSLADSSAHTLPPVILGTPETPGYVEAIFEFEADRDIRGEELEIVFSGVVASTHLGSSEGLPATPTSERIQKKRWLVPLTFQSEGIIAKGLYRRTVGTVIDPTWPSTMTCAEGHVKYDIEARLARSTSYRGKNTRMKTLARDVKEFIVWNCNISQFESQRSVGATSLLSSSSSTSAPALQTNSENPTRCFPSPPSSPSDRSATSALRALTVGSAAGPRHSVTGVWSKARLPITLSIPSESVAFGESVPIKVQFHVRPQSSEKTSVVLVEGRITVQQIRHSRNVYDKEMPNVQPQKMFTIPVTSTMTAAEASGVEGTCKEFMIKIPNQTLESRVSYCPTAFHPTIKSKYFDVEHQISFDLKLRLSDQKDRQASKVELILPIRLVNPRPFVNENRQEEPQSEGLLDREQNREISTLPDYQDQALTTASAIQSEELAPEYFAEDRHGDLNSAQSAPPTSGEQLDSVANRQNDVDLELPRYSEARF